MVGVTLERAVWVIVVLLRATLLVSYSMVYVEAGLICQAEVSGEAASIDIAIVHVGVETRHQVARRQRILGRVTQLWHIGWKGRLNH